MTRALRILALLLLTLGAAQTCPPIAHAQGTAASDQGAPDYEAWERVASRAEDTMASGAASNDALEALRAQLVEWRTRFLGAQDINSSRIKTLRDQISALGAAPAEGESEPEEIAARRGELNRQLAELQAPAVKAVEAHSRADGLIREIDSVIRERQADRLLDLGPSPVNPVHWGPTLAELAGSARELMRETAQTWGSPSGQSAFRANLPATMLLLLVALVLIARGRTWVEKLTQKVIENRVASRRGVYAGLVSLGQVALPLAGVFALSKGLQSTGLPGTVGTQLIALLPVMGVTFLTARWLGARTFAETSVSRPIFMLSSDRQAEGRFISAVLGALLVLAYLLDNLGRIEGYGPAVSAVATFPVVLVAGLMLARMGQLLLAHARSSGPGQDDRPYRTGMARFEGRAAIVLGLLGPALGAVGYIDLANYLVYSSVLTLALLGFVLIMQRFVSDAYDMALNREGRAGEAQEESASDALIPVLIGLLLALLALPILALIWGARVADLTEIWARFTEGFNIGQTRISPADFLTFVIVFTIGYTLTRLVQGTLRSTVLPKTRIDPGGQTAIVSGMGYVGIFLAVIIAVTTAGIDLSSLAIVAGALSVGIGFGLQTIVSNFVSGIILLIERPISQGDWIEVGGVMGIVQDISVRSTRIQTFDRTDVIVPNADLVSGQVTNWTRQNLTGRVILTVGVAYGTDTRKVEKILHEIGENHPLVMINPPPTVVFQGFGADALEFELRVILRDINYGLSVRTELNHEIARRFMEEGIEIPFAQRDIWLRNPETIASAPAPAPRTPPQPRQSDDPQPAPRDDLDGDVDADGPDAR